MNDKEIIDLANTYIIPTYNRHRIAIVKGKGASVWSADGKKYLDFVNGLAANNLGHSYAPVNKAISKQMSRLGRTSNLYYTEPQALYAKALVEKIYKGKVFFCNSGTEANEAALKLARRYSMEKKGKACREIIAFEGSFHGRTMGSLSLTHGEKYREGFGSMLPGVKHVPYGDLKAVEKAITEKTCAVIIEPVQGESGVHVPTITFVQKLARLCSSKKILLIFDEVQTGFGRTGALFAFRHFKVKPDIITMAKAIANGYPMGAMFAKPEIAKSFTPGTHAATFGGSPAACAGALVALQTLSSEELLENVRSMGRYMIIRLTGMKSAAPVINHVRGLGLMIGVEMAVPCSYLVEKCAKSGLLVNCTNKNTLRFLPPLNVTRAEVDKALNILGKLLGA